jgi:hypothetical protein
MDWISMDIAFYCTRKGEHDREYTDIPKEFLGFPIAWNGTRLKYKLNGLATTILSIIGIAAAVKYGYFDTAIIPQYYGQLIIVGNIWAYSVSLLMYIKGIIFQQVIIVHTLIIYNL